MKGRTGDLLLLCESRLSPYQFSESDCPVDRANCSKILGKPIHIGFGKPGQLHRFAKRADHIVKSKPAITTTVDGWTVTAGGKLYSKGTAKVDPNSPLESDVTYNEGHLAGKTLRQISKIEGDVLIACIGAERPTEFKSKAGGGHTLSVWIRVK